MPTQTPLSRRDLLRASVVGTVASGLMVETTLPVAAAADARPDLDPLTLGEMHQALVKQLVKSANGPRKGGRRAGALNQLDHLHRLDVVTDAQFKILASIVKSVHSDQRPKAIAAQVAKSFVAMRRLPITNGSAHALASIALDSTTTAAQGDPPSVQDGGAALAADLDAAMLAMELVETVPIFLAFSPQAALIFVLGCAASASALVLANSKPVFNGPRRRSSSTRPS